MEHEQIGIAADLVLEIGPLLPRPAAIAAHVHADAGRDVDAVRIQRIDHRAVDVVVHARDDAKRLARVGALQEAALLDADEQRVVIVRVEVDVLGVGDVRRRREAPARRVDRAQRRELGPAAAEVVAAEQVRGLRARVDTNAVAHPRAGEAVHVLLPESLVTPLPGAAAISACEQGAVLHAREDRAARRLDQQGVDVLVGQRPVGDVPSRAGGVTLEGNDALDGADQNLPGGSGRPVHRGAAMRKRDGHERLLRIQ
jgi:hypothetical protein